MLICLTSVIWPEIRESLLVNTFTAKQQVFFCPGQACESKEATAPSRARRKPEAIEAPSTKTIMRTRTLEVVIIQRIKKTISCDSAFGADCRAPTPISIPVKIIVALLNCNLAQASRLPKCILRQSGWLPSANSQKKRGAQQIVFYQRSCSDKSRPPSCVSTPCSTAAPKNVYAGVHLPGLAGACYDVPTIYIFSILVGQLLAYL